MTLSFFIAITKTPPSAYDDSETKVSNITKGGK